MDRKAAETIEGAQRPFAFGNAALSDKVSGEGWLLLAILIASAILNTTGIGWGLPYRWNSDEPVASVLRMMANRTLVNYDDLTHPPLFSYLLALWMSPYLLFLKLSGYPFGPVAEAASVSWIKMAHVAPDFARGIYLTARLLSGALGVATVYLVYRLGRLLFGPGPALAAAGLLALTKGHMGVAHFAQSHLLVSFLLVSSLYFSVRALKGENPERPFKWACLLGGLALTGKYNGGIALLPLLATYGILVRRGSPGKESQSLRRRIFLNPLLAKGTLFYLLGILIGWPTLVSHFHLYMGESIPEYLPYWASGSPGVSAGFGPLALSLLLMLVTSYGLPSAAAIALGIGIALKRGAGLKGPFIVFAFFAIPYFIIFSSIGGIHPENKFLVPLFPLLALFGGLGIFSFLTWERLGKKLRVGIFSMGLAYTLALVISAEAVFFNDTREQATRWVEANVPRGASIEVPRQIGKFLSARILDNYNIVFLGKESRHHPFGTNFKALRDASEVRKYLLKIYHEGPRADYFVSHVPAVYGRVKTESFCKSIGGGIRQAITCKLLAGEFGYRLAARFELRHISRWNILWNISPSDYTSPTIFIFRRGKDASFRSES
ncbi:MAG: ArnT family glycosyltransferase [Nitrospinota bacterium]